MSNTNLPNGNCVDRSGMTFGRWKVLSFAGIRNGLTIWNCKCSCGTVREVRGNGLSSGQSTSCGCLRRERAFEASALPDGIAAAKSLFTAYQRGARERKLEFRLSFEEFLLICSGDCTYCGVQPSDVYTRERSNGPFIHNGVDRVDNEKGYVQGNMVTCCTKCNSAKSSLDLEEFNTWRRKIASKVRQEENRDSIPVSQEA